MPAQYTMEVSEPQSSPSITSSVCDVCRGLFDISSPRGFVIDGYDADEPRTFHQRYIYTYIHHKTESDLMLSADSGCGLCKTIGASLGLKSPAAPIRASYPRSQCESATQPSKGADAADPGGPGLGGSHIGCDPEDISEKDDPGKDQLDQNDWEPSKLASFVKHKPGLCDESAILFHCQGRFIIQHRLEKETGLELDSSIAACKIYRPSHKRSVWSGESLNHFSTPFDPIDPNWEHRPSNDLLSECHVSLIDRWRNICDREHESCHRITYDQPLPTRILEIIGSAEDNEPARLVETQRKKRGTYACLSYCWGDLKAQAGQTTRENLSKQLQGIPLRDLPSTVVDAIKLCLKLKYRYLWVDRLCIIQDDREDWSVEASRMCEVYSRSALTISVPVCIESSQSFLAERTTGFREQSRFISITYGKETTGKHQRWFSRDPLSRENGPWFLERNWKDDYSQGEDGDNRWLGRGWTFQEWMLSPRVLHIDSMTLWDCFQGYANELNCRNMTSANILRDPSMLGKGIPWEAVVQEYSRREITREGDRLPALAGLAERYAKVTGKTYLAGLWLEDLPCALLWVQQFTRRRPPRAWCARRHTPSWSWPSLNTGVWYGEFRAIRGNSTALASIRSNLCQYNPPGSFARVEKAWIDLSCRVSAVTKRGDNWIRAGEKAWDAHRNYDYDHGSSYMSDVENVYLLLLTYRATHMHGVYGALIAKRFEGDDGCTCFRRLGVAELRLRSGESLEEGTHWEERVVRLV